MAKRASKDTKKSPSRANRTAQKKTQPKPKAKKRAPGATPGLRIRLRTYWQRFRAALPTWLDEIGAFLLIVFGLVSLVILLGLSSTDAWLAISWGDTLRQLFGPPGALVAAGTIVAGGLYVLLPKVGVRIPLAWHRVLAGEIGFFALLALLHLLTADGRDPRLRAELGAGGGYGGWALSEAVSAVAGPLVSLVVWGLVFAVAALVVLGVRRRSVRHALNWLNARARRVAQQIDADGPAAHPAPTGSRPARRKEKAPSRKPKPRSEPHVRLSSPGVPGERESVVPRDENTPPPPPP
ncbi:MAG: hypothetical protein JXB47_02150, partial [Anaerolineae bacterium]|nr:hypothetical protein [Anaerolineae bacterium]